MPTNPLYLLRVNARELLRQPGTDRSITVELAPGDLGIDDARITGDIAVDLVATSNIDGIVVSGEVAMPWRAPCRRCLTDVRGTAGVEVDELYQDDVSDEDAYAIEGDQIDLAPAVREYVLLELPDDPLCRDDCAGICPVCGIDRNTASCECDTSVRDERWAALDDLRLDDS
ncbi:MAG: DUF177 domain-containing protein [Ilumatobacter sp.]|uniref:YceD family protein n=1 Tax=Ilumatobacter sp. TaxID=1967498 RepID=UPI00262A06B2|nr:DUF177 domain-containing protein [Ilumatobacter sp.]MDJ0770762.1 DUF177 domain-containing protein [Ilumatobacter sp.]